MADTRISFIGGGNMAEGLIRGMTKSGKFAPGSIHVFDVVAARGAYLHAEYGVLAEASAADACRQADVVVFAVKPQDAALAAGQIRDLLAAECVFVSICAGVLIGKLEALVGEARRIVRIMPNTLTETGHGFSAYCANSNTRPEDLVPVVAILESVGQALQVREELFDSFTGYGCAGPVYLLYVMTALIDAGVRSGLARRDARAIAIENMIGTAIKLEQTGQHPYQILDTMTSPGGVGIEGVYTMEQGGIAGVLMRAVAESARRSGELG